MAWWTLGLGRRNKAVPVSDERSLTAAAIPVQDARSQFLRSSDAWQEEVWNYWENLGELRYATDWKSAMLSRVRFYAAELLPGQDEPARLEDNSTPVQLMTMLAGGVAGQAGLISSLTTQLDIPGEGYLIGESDRGAEKWSVRSVDEVRAHRSTFEVIREDSLQGAREWRTLAPDHLVVLVRRPHKRWSYLPDSPARAARAAMRELELVNRHISAQYLSRLASAGVFLYPQEIEFPVKEEYADAPDPFAAEFIEIAAQAIREPGTAAGVVPIPIKVPGEYLDKVKHLDFTLELDERIIDKRDSAIKRLAMQLNIPSEVLLGMSDVNHWSAWQLEEGALKTVIAPDAELISQALTTGYLQPRLIASRVPQEEAARFVVWYDTSELSIRPDRSSNAFRAYDRLEIDGDALRRETGFSPEDKPEGEELAEQAQKLLLRTFSQLAPTMLRDLTGSDPDLVPLPGRETEPSDEGPDSDSLPEDREEPGTIEDEPPEQDMGARRTERLMAQSRAPHLVRFSVSGTEVLHPPLCDSHAYSCPYTQGALTMGRSVRPGRSGTYECSLDAFGTLRVGDMAPMRSTVDLLVTGGLLNGIRR